MSDDYYYRNFRCELEKASALSFKYENMFYEFVANYVNLQFNRFSLLTQMGNMYLRHVTPTPFDDEKKKGEAAHNFMFMGNPQAHKMFVENKGFILGCMIIDDNNDRECQFIEFIDSRVRGKNFARLMIQKYQETTEKWLLPRQIIGSATKYWVRWFANQHDCITLQDFQNFRCNHNLKCNQIDWNYLYENLSLVIAWMSPHERATTPDLLQNIENLTENCNVHEWHCKCCMRPIDKQQMQHFQAAAQLCTECTSDSRLKHVLSYDDIPENQRNYVEFRRAESWIYAQACYGVELKVKSHDDDDDDRGQGQGQDSNRKQQNCACCAAVSYVDFWRGSLWCSKDCESLMTSKSTIESLITSRAQKREKETHKRGKKKRTLVKKFCKRKKNTK